MENNKKEQNLLDFIKEEFQQLEWRLASAVRISVKEAFEKLIKCNGSNDTSLATEFLSAEKTAEFLKIKINTLYSKVEKGDLPFYRSGKRKLLFSKKELHEYISKRKGKNIEEISIDIDNHITEK